LEYYKHIEEKWKSEKEKEFLIFFEEGSQKEEFENWRCFYNIFKLFKEKVLE
jgi:hypothetical protein